MAERSLARRLWYEYLRLACRLLGVALYRVRCTGRENVPATGGVLVLSNHQSQFDPVLVGLAIDRRLNYLARETLFRFAPFRWLIKSLDAIHIATALAIGDRDLQFITYDNRQADAARQAGLKVIQPGR